MTVIEAGDRLLGRAVTPLLSDAVRDAHERRGTRVLLGASAVGLIGEDEHTVGVELADGAVLDADVVVVGIGVDPRTDLASQLGLTVEPRGIVVDEHARTSDGLTVAAGDCAVGPNPFVRGLARADTPRERGACHRPGTRCCSDPRGAPGGIRLRAVVLERPG